MLLTIMSGLEISAFVIGTAGLASLPKTIWEVTEGIKSYKQFDSDSRPYFALSNAARVSYKQWSESVGFDQNGLKDDHHKALDDPGVLNSVYEIIESIQGIVGDAENNQPNVSSQPTLAGPSSRGSNVRPKKRTQLEKFQGSTSRKTKLDWASGGKDTISEKIQLVESLLRRLYELVPPQELNDTGHTQASQGNVVPIHVH